MTPSYEIIIFYKYTLIKDPEGCVRWQKKLCERIGMYGRILIAHEGINGTVEGTKEQIEEYCRHMHAQDGNEESFADFHDIWFKASPGTGTAFKKLKVKARKEIVSTGLSKEENINPNELTGTHIEAEELKKWMEQKEEVEIIDMRNDYEYAVGHFAGSHKSGMKNFRDLQAIAPQFNHLKNKKIVTVCTYGVRCEKASGYLKRQGFKDVYQLHGGIGTYMKKYPGKDFEGSLYVFDNRMTEQFTSSYDVIGSCTQCQQPSERYGNCAWSECHKQLIICSSCAQQSVWCSDVCQQKTEEI